MADTVDIQTDSIIFTDGTTGNVRGLKAKDDNLDFVTGALTKIARVNNVAFILKSALPSATLNGLWFYCTDTDELYLDSGTTMTQISGATHTYVRAFRETSNQLIPQGITTKVEFNAETEDVLSEYDNVTNYRFTASTGGIYTIICQLRMPDSDNPVNSIIFYFKKNGSDYITRKSCLLSNSAGTTYLLSDIIQLSANDYLEVFLYTDQVGGVNINSSEVGTFLCIKK